MKYSNEPLSYPGVEYVVNTRFPVPIQVYIKIYMNVRIPINNLDGDYKYNLKPGKTTFLHVLVYMLALIYTIQCTLYSIYNVHCNGYTVFLIGL